MIDISTDRGSVLPPDASALIFSADSELSMMMADLPPDAPVPRMVRLLAAVLLRCTDDDWVEEMLAVFDQAPRS